MMDASSVDTAPVPQNIETVTRVNSTPSPQGSRRSLFNKWPQAFNRADTGHGSSGSVLADDFERDSAPTSLGRLMSQRLMESKLNNYAGRIGNPVDDSRAPGAFPDVQLIRADMEQLFNAALIARGRKSGKNQAPPKAHLAGQNQLVSNAHNQSNPSFEGEDVEAQLPSLRKRKTQSTTHAEMHSQDAESESLVLATGDEDTTQIQQQEALSALELSDDDSQKASSSKSVDWQKEVDAVDCAIFCEIKDEDKKLVANYCRNANRQAWFNIGTLMPGRLRNVSSLGHSNDLRRLDPKVLGSFCLASANIRDVILNSKGGGLTEKSIESVLNFICQYIQKFGFRDSADGTVSIDHMVSTATILVEKYGREEETDKKFDQTIIKFTGVALRQLEQSQPNDLRERKAGLIMGILLAAMHRNLDRNHKIVVNCVAATSVAVTALWAWSYLRSELAVAAAVAVTAFTLFEYLNLSPARKFGVNEVNLVVSRLTLNDDNGLGFWFEKGIQYAKQVNNMEGC